MPTVTFAAHARFHFAASSAMKLHAFIAADPVALVYGGRAQIAGFSLLPVSPSSLTLIPSGFFLANAMVCDGGDSGDPSYAEYDLGATEAELWLTAYVYLDSATLAAWIDGTTTSYLMRILTGPSGSSVDAAYTQPLPWGTARAGTGAIDAEGGVWALLELHRVAGGVTELYVDGVLAITGTDADASVGGAVQFGLTQSSGVAPSLVSVRDVKVGTTRGGSDVFADDFASGNLDAWTSTLGDPTVAQVLVPRPNVLTLTPAVPV